LFLSLALLEAGILFVDHIQPTLATNDLAINAAFFNGCSYFHFFSFLPPAMLLALFNYIFPSAGSQKLPANSLFICI
jgi:hypothetical protein